MSLSVDSRPCGKVYLVKCSGRIVTGEESTALQAAINRALMEFNRLVLDVSDVERVDSSGMGLLVRFLSHTRNRGGDLRLAAPQNFFRSLLQMTKLSTIFRIYDNEEEAVISFLKEPATASAATGKPGPLVLFVDQSPDLCAFVRTLLNRYGYEVLSTCRMRDARTLLSAADVDYIVLGPESAQLPFDNMAASLKLLAPKAIIVQLESGFQLSDPDRASSELLQKLQGHVARA